MMEQRQQLEFVLLSNEILLQKAIKKIFPPNHHTNCGESTFLDPGQAKRQKGVNLSSFENKKNEKTLETIGGSLLILELLDGFCQIEKVVLKNIDCGSVQIFVCNDLETQNWTTFSCNISIFPIWVPKILGDFTKNQEIFSNSGKQSSSQHHWYSQNLQKKVWICKCKTDAKNEEKLCFCQAQKQIPSFSSSSSSSSLSSSSSSSSLSCSSFSSSLSSSSSSSFSLSFSSSSVSASPFFSSMCCLDSGLTKFSQTCSCGRPLEQSKFEKIDWNGLLLNIPAKDIFVPCVATWKYVGILLQPRFSQEIVENWGKKAFFRKEAIDHYRCRLRGVSIYGKPCRTLEFLDQLVTHGTAE